MPQGVGVQVPSLAPLRATRATGLDPCSLSACLVRICSHLAATGWRMASSLARRPQGRSLGAFFFHDSSTTTHVGTLFASSGGREEDGTVTADQPVRTGILVLTHGQAGEQLIRKSAEMIIGPIDAIAAVPLMPGQSPEEYRVEVERVLRTMPAQNLILTDLFGGTPSNLAAALSADWPLWVVLGAEPGDAHQSRGIRGRACRARNSQRMWPGRERETVKNITALLPRDDNGLDGRVDYGQYRTRSD